MRGVLLVFLPSCSLDLGHAGHQRSARHTKRCFCVCGSTCACAAAAAASIKHVPCALRPSVPTRTESGVQCTPSCAATFEHAEPDQSLLLAAAVAAVHVAAGLSEAALHNSDLAQQAGPAGAPHVLPPATRQQLALIRTSGGAGAELLPTHAVNAAA